VDGNDACLHKFVTTDTDLVGFITNNYSQTKYFYKWQHECITMHFNMPKLVLWWK